MTTADAIDLQEKLHPRLFPGMSPKMAAIVGYIIGARCTDPAIAELVVTADGFLLARQEGDIGCNDFLGDASDLERNWARLLECAKLDSTMRQKAQAAYDAAVTDWRRDD